MEEKASLNRITQEIIGAAIEVHRTLGPGLLESAYETCLVFELRERSFQVEQQKPLPILYKTVKLDCGYRLHLVVDNRVIVEIKAVEKLNSIHEAQLLSYLRLYGCKLGLLINFHVPLLRNGIRRIVNEFPDSANSAISAV
ncbi:MAG TPA: GxxExxY protein [Terriglobales bacterium]|nr:GxxExxY protein [Terriglobales bacterium]